MSMYQTGSACRNCNSPLRPGAKFCSVCGTPCAAKPARAVFSPTHWSLILCYVLFCVSVLYAWFWRDLYNWYMDLLKDYGSHIYWTTASQVYEVVRAAIMAAGTTLAFIFDARGKKKIAVLSAALIFLCLLITEIADCAYFVGTLGDRYTMLDFVPYLITQILLDVIYPALLVCFVLWNNKLQKWSLLFPIVNILFFLLFKQFDLFATAASTLGMAKYWVRQPETY